ncbi:hypothetical protein A3C28_02005 [Candidatus Roizmanbacteria bacterium RIFCSPHIGHO2_02_FULL_39_9]|uniref:PIN domain-containing protein n=1 Tax=Candidatus Roizmanbacteria bacterium RIFCSPHIGHO2_02_FULL_39_9 TaxID=1802040 RepID=A0A1F7H8B0_9BACT|nr:MAG: hypothetical protein A3C28_02005 [Candidatus Roizmanbacteria bacterium RIFCSPHIGHO2_02_FULL_39_9]
MTAKIKVYFDSDVIISSLFSSRGAADILLKTAEIKPLASDLQKKELRTVAGRLKLDLKKLEILLNEKFSLVKIKKTETNIEKKFLKYVLDPDDAHIVAGIATSKPSFFVSYNQRHFLANKIKTDLKVISLIPAQLLQYLRSR